MCFVESISILFQGEMFSMFITQYVWSTFALVFKNFITVLIYSLEKNDFAHLQVEIVSIMVFSDNRCRDFGDIRLSKEPIEYATIASAADV